MNVNQKLFVLVALLLVVSCSRNSKLETALELAGDNRAELQKVLEHYKKDPADSLKYKAACFLIENMRWHYGAEIKPSEKFWDLLVQEDSLITPMMRNPDDPDIQRAYSVFMNGERKELINSALEQLEESNRNSADLLSLDASFLIENIDAAFQVRQSGLCSHLPFNTFCEYVLPYRIYNEPVYPARKAFTLHFGKTGLLDTVNSDSYHAAKLLMRYFNYFKLDGKSIPPDIGIYSLCYWNRLKVCSEKVSTFCGLMRSVGLPVGEVFTPKWRDMNLGHSWGFLLRPDSSLMLFDPQVQEQDSFPILDPLRATKIYKRTFALHPESAHALKAAGEKIPAFYDTPCLEDVTGHFLPVRDVELKLSHKLKENNLCWFSVFKTGNWMPIAWGKLNRTKNKVLFKDISTGLTGIACSFDGHSVVPRSQLVTVTADGIRYIGPGDEKTTLMVKRKFPVSIRLQGMRDQIPGTKIQGANRSDFSDRVTVHVIGSILEPYFQDVEFSNPGSFRYYRLEAPAHSRHLNIAELEFITKTKLPGLNEATPLPVFEKNQPAQEVYYKISYAALPASPDTTLSDGDMLTYCTRKFVEADLGKPYQINRIRIAPRNTHNGIVVGDNYKLFYWDNEWVSAGTQQARYNYLEFTGVPANTLYWLRNLDHGEQEQPFFFEKGKQVFSNQPIVGRQLLPNL